MNMEYGSFSANNWHRSTENKCVLFGHFLLLQYILVSSGSQEKPCHKRRIKAYFQQMSQHVKMEKVVQTVCVTREIRNL